ncbi:unnamed protein product [Ascophyllum nodosum]
MAEEAGLQLPDFEESDFYVEQEHVTIGPSVGEGAFSTVYIGKYFGDVVAVKKQTRQGRDLEKYLLRELSVLKYIRHQNMLEYIGAYNVIAKARGQLHAVYIVTEYAQGGDLLKLLLRKDVSLGWRFRIQIAKEGAEALEYLHSQQLIHRDIKSSNFLLDADWHCKLSDFGMAREVSSNGKMTICGTDEYMAPEMLFDESFSYPADIFSFGMVLLELITRKKIGENGFARRTPAKLFALEAEDVRQESPPDAPDSLLSLAIMCMEYEADERPSADETRAWLEELLTELPNDTCPIPEPLEIPAIPETEGHNDMLATPPPSSNADNNYNSSQPSPQPSTSTTLPDADQTHIAGRNRAHWTGDKESNSGLPSPPAVAGDDDSPSFFGSSKKPNSMGHEVESFIPSKMGYLHIKNQGLGFRNWKKRWFVLKGAELVCYKDGGHIETVGLRDCAIKRGKASRFQILKVRVERNKPTEVKDGLEGVEEMELAATNESSLEAWLSTLESSIAYANAQRSSNSENQAPPHVNLGGNGYSDTIMDWLLDLRLEGLWPKFEAHGFTDLKKIKQQGLKASDLDELDIKNPLHRRFLLDVGRSPFRNTLKVSVVGHRAFGDIVMFKVVTEWRAWYSKTEKLYTDFNKLHNKLRRAFKETNSPLMENLPPLPGKGQVVQDHKNPVFLAKRKTDLEAYLKEVAALVEHQEPFFSLLCEALDLSIT